MFPANRSNGTAAPCSGPLDRDSFLALYAVLEPGMSPDEVAAALAGWTATAYRVQDGFALGDEHLSFGAWSRGVWAVVLGRLHAFQHPPCQQPDPDRQRHVERALGRPGAGRRCGSRRRGPDRGSRYPRRRYRVHRSQDLGRRRGSLDRSRVSHGAVAASPTASRLWVRSFADSTGEIMGGLVGPNHEGMAGTLERYRSVGGVRGNALAMRWIRDLSSSVGGFLLITSSPSAAA